MYTDSFWILHVMPIIFKKAKPTLRQVTTLAWSHGAGLSDPWSVCLTSHWFLLAGSPLSHHCPLIMAHEWPCGEVTGWVHDLLNWPSVTLANLCFYNVEGAFLWSSLWNEVNELVLPSQGRNVTAEMKMRRAELFNKAARARKTKPTCRHWIQCCKEALQKIGAHKTCLHLVFYFGLLKLKSHFLLVCHKPLKTLSIWVNSNQKHRNII